MPYEKMVVRKLYTNQGYKDIYIQLLKIYNDSSKSVEYIREINFFLDNFVCVFAIIKLEICHYNRLPYYYNY